MIGHCLVCGMSCYQPITVPNRASHASHVHNVGSAPFIARPLLLRPLLLMSPASSTVYANGSIRSMIPSRQA
jgi:hypothetical protein